MDVIGTRRAAFLSTPRHTHSTSRPTNLTALARTLRPCDVLLVEGNSRISTAIKYLTQSTWSHAPLYVGEDCRPAASSGASPCFVEADVVEGVDI
jgi:hypothetical protein